MKLALLSSYNYSKFDINFSMEAWIRFFPSVYLNNLIYALYKSSVDNESILLNHCTQTHLSFNPSNVGNYWPAVKIFKKSFLGEYILHL